MDRIMDNIHSSVGRNVRLIDNEEIVYLYENCAGECGPKRFMAAFFAYCIVSSPRDGGDGLAWATWELMDLFGEYEELHSAVLDNLRDTNGEVLINPGKESLQNTECVYHEHAEAEYCPSR
jgi:hypothetical protein